MLDNINLELVFGIDKQMHFIIFFLLSLGIGLLILLVTPKSYSRRNLGLVWFTVILIGIIEEYRQFFAPGRSTEFLDAIANILGVSCGLLLPFFIMSFYKQEARNRGLLFLYMTLIAILSFGLWEMNQRPFLR